MGHCLAAAKDAIWRASAAELTGSPGGGGMTEFLFKAWRQEEGQDVAEYAVMLAVVLVIVVGTVRLIGSNASNVFSQVGSALQ